MKPTIKYCPSTLFVGFNTYSPSAIKNLFNGKKVNHILPYDAPSKDEDVAAKFIENRKRISISGVQEKLSLILDKNKLRLTNEGEQGTHILKPIPRDLLKINQVPANEHLTMQIASRFYKINTAYNGLIFFNNGEPAYITKRFDVKSDESKWGKEDFASLAGKSADTDGSDFKYNFSYEEAALLVKKYVNAWQIEIEKFFSLVIFNYLFSNGDAHLKNFSLLETTSGDYILSPAYDLSNTHIHINDTDFGLNKGLFADDYQSEQFKKNGHASKYDFIKFGKRIGVKEKRIERVIEYYSTFSKKYTNVKDMVNHSFLDESNKRAYFLYHQTKLNYFNSK